MKTRCEPSVLAQLRHLAADQVAPSQRGQRRLAERQAMLLRLVTTASDAPIEQVICHLPRIHVHWADIPTSGLSHWNGEEWVITINAFEPRTRQRFTVLHEFKHIIDHPARHALYRGGDAAEQMEQAADYFAGCVLVPAALLIADWGEGCRTTSELADRFDVSTRAIQVRLRQVGLGTQSQQITPANFAAELQAAADERKTA